MNNIKKNALYSFLFAPLLAAWIGTIYVLRQKVPLIKKINAVHEVAANRKHVISSFFNSVGLYFWKLYPKTWEPGLEPTKEQKREQRKLFGYNLRIEHIIDNDPQIIKNSKRPTVFIHGWGDTKGSARILKAYCDVLPGDIVTFNFRDRGVIFPKFQHSSLGQLPDVLQALYVLKWTKDQLKVNAIDLFGYSRGGATTINMIAVLNDKTGKYDDELARIGIDELERKKLLETIQNGCIVLNCPLIDLNITAEYRFKNFAWEALKAFATVSKYELDGIQPIESAAQFEGLNLKILMHFQHGDHIVSNNKEAEFYKRLAYHNPYSTFIVLGNDGGHLHTHCALSETIHAFKKMYDGSYDPDYVDQYRHEKHKNKYANKLLQPGDKVQECIEGYYDLCKQSA